MSWPLIAGLGSYNGDDRAGWLALDRLRDLGYPISLLLPLSQPAKLLEKIEPEQSLVICDACVGGKDCGRVRSFHWPSDQVTYDRGSGSHDLCLNDILELARELGCSPRSVTVWTIEGGQWEVGSSPAEAVRSAADHVGDLIWERHRHA